MEFIVSHWYLLFAFAALVTVIAVQAYRFGKMPTTDQMDAIREWLLMAVTEAEKELGCGTGKLKLRYVYDLFVSRFPWAAKVVPFSAFSNLVDEALVEMHEMLEQNEKVNSYVHGKGETA